MASEIVYRADGTGLTLYAVLGDITGQIWNTSGTPALETMTVAHWTDYDVALTETPAGGYLYVGDMPSTFAKGRFMLRIFQQAGGSPAITDTMIHEAEVWWDGTYVSGYGQLVPGQQKSWP